MSPVVTTTQVENEISILARVLTNEQGLLSPEVARYLLSLRFSDQDQARMHDLALRNQNGELSAVEREELIAFGEVGDLLSILKLRARRTLGIKLEIRNEA